jgi:hypothetical protein
LAKGFFWSPVNLFQKGGQSFLVKIKVSTAFFAVPTKEPFASVFCAYPVSLANFFEFAVMNPAIIKFIGHSTPSDIMPSKWWEALTVCERAPHVKLHTALH